MPHEAYAATATGMQKQVEVVGVSAASSSVTVTSNNSAPNPSPVIKIENSNFEAKGKITSVSGDNFDIEGVTVTKSPKYQVAVFGNIEIGKNAEVKGVLEDGLRYAKEIRIEGSATPTPQASSLPSTADTPAASSPNKEIKVSVSAAAIPSPKSSGQLPAVQSHIPAAFIVNQNVPLPVSSAIPATNPLPEERETLIKPVISFFENWFKSLF